MLEWQISTAWLGMLANHQEQLRSKSLLSQTVYVTNVIKIDQIISLLGKSPSRLNKKRLDLRKNELKMTANKCTETTQGILNDCKIWNEFTILLCTAISDKEGKILIGLLLKARLFMVLIESPETKL